VKFSLPYIVFSVCSLGVFAQGQANPAATQFSPWASLIGNLSFGALSWYLIGWQIPAMQKTFTDSLEKEREARKEERQAFKNELAEERRFFQTAMNQILELKKLNS